MKIYISGKISDLPTEQVKEKFAKAEAQIRAFGHEPVNPLDNGQPSTATWAQQMTASLAMLFECDAIYFLPDWVESRGARIEAKIAQECGLEILHLPEYGTYESKV